MSGPSDKAVEAAAQRVPAYRDKRLRDVIREDMRDKIAAAYPIIRAELVAEVVEAIKREHARLTEEYVGKAGPSLETFWPLRLIEREFGLNDLT